MATLINAIKYADMCSLLRRKIICFDILNSGIHVRRLSPQESIQICWWFLCSGAGSKFVFNCVHVFYCFERQSLYL